MTTSTDSANGQVFLADGGTDLNAITKIVKLLIARMDVCKLVKVVAVHPGSGTPPKGGTVDVLPLVSQIDGDGFGVQHKTVFGLPFFRLGGGKWQIVCDPAVGDYGYVICADRDSSKVVANPGQQLPGSRRRYNLADGIYVGGLINPAPTAWVFLKSDGTFQISDSHQNVVESTNSGIDFKVGGTTILTLASSLATFSVNIQAPDAALTTGNVTSVATHTHHVSAAPGESNPPTSGT